MKLLAEIYNLIEPSEMDKGGTEMKYPNVYREKGKIGAKTKISKKTVVLRNSATGSIYGRRTIYSK